MVAAEPREHQPVDSAEIETCVDGRATAAGAPTSITAACVPGLYHTTFLAKNEQLQRLHFRVKTDASKTQTSVIKNAEHFEFHSLIIGLLGKKASAGCFIWDWSLLFVSYRNPAERILFLARNIE